MKNLIKRLFGFENGSYKKATDLRNDIIKEKKKDIKELKEINRTIKMSLQEGDIEVTIKNVKGILEELK